VRQYKNIKRAFRNWRLDCRTERRRPDIHSLVVRITRLKSVYISVQRAWQCVFVGSCYRVFFAVGVFVEVTVGCKNCSIQVARTGKNVTRLKYFGNGVEGGREKRRCRPTSASLSHAVVPAASSYERYPPHRLNTAHLPADSNYVRLEGQCHQFISDSNLGIWWKL